MGTRGVAGVLFFLFGLVTHDAAPRSPRDATPTGTRTAALARKWAGLETMAVGSALPASMLAISFPGSIRPCIPGPEVCNFRDDDCNGAIDDGLGIMTCGIGACASSVPACSAGIAGRCIPRPPGEETCNGADDDCDGETDEGVCAGAAPSSGSSGDDAPQDVGCGCRCAGGEGSAGAAGWWILAVAIGKVRRKRSSSGRSAK